MYCTYNVYNISHGHVQIMRNLLGTHMGHCSIYTMVRFLQSGECQSDAHLLRGAVFHITMALWSAKKVDKLKCTNTSILPAFHTVSCLVN